MLASVDDQPRPVKILHSNEVTFEVVVEKFVVTAKGKYFLLLKLSHDKLVHLRLSDLALIEHVPNLLNSALHFNFELMFDNIETCLKYAINFSGVTYFNFLRFNLLADLLLLLKLLRNVVLAIVLVTSTSECRKVGVL